MTYSIIKTNGSPLPVIGDAVRDDSSTSLSLVGKNYANYGIVLNENFVHLLENFANATAPISPLEGQLWWNSTAKNLRVYSGDGWKSMVSSTAGAVQPASPAQGDQWFNTNVNQLRVWNGSNWVAIGPLSNPGIGLTGPVAESVTDTANPPQTHVVVKNYIENQVVSIVSKDATFTPASPLDGFPLISHGVTLSATYSLAPSANSLVTKQYVDQSLSSAALADMSVTPDQLSIGGPYWDTTGNFGIGTLTPGQKLSVVGTIESTVGGFKFPDGTTQTTAVSGSFVLSDGIVTPAKLSTGGPHWTVDGNLGVGTTTPAFKLDVSGFGRFTTGIAINGGNSLQLLETANNNSWYFANNSNNLTFAYNSSERMRIDSAGNVGIGTATPGYPLQVKTTSTTNQNTISMVNEPVENLSALAWVQAGSNTLAYTSIHGDGRATGFMAFRTNDTERMRIVANGNVGIGTTTPASKLDVFGDITLGASFTGLGTQRINFRGANTDYANIRFESSGDLPGASALILETWDNSDEPIVFKQSGATRMAIGTNVGIGTVNPTQKLTVAGTVESTTGGFKFPDGTTQTTAFSAAAAGGLGVGQNWQAVTRYMDTTYTNTTGKPIMLIGRAERGTYSTAGIHIYINGAGVPLCFNTNSGGGNTAVGSIIIPTGANYYMQVSSESLSNYQFYELR